MGTEEAAKKAPKKHKLKTKRNKGKTAIKPPRPTLAQGNPLDYIGLILVVSNRKGGVGKTMYSTHLAWMLGATLVDLDRQGNAYSFCQEANLTGHHAPGASAEELDRILSEAAANGPVVVDCPPGESMLAYIALGRADAILIPFLPGKDDWEAVADQLLLVRDVQKLNPGLKVMAVQNGALVNDENGVTGASEVFVKSAIAPFNGRYVGSARFRKIYKIAKVNGKVVSQDVAVEEMLKVFGNILDHLADKTA